MNSYFYKLNILNTYKLVIKENLKDVQLEIKQTKANISTLEKDKDVYYHGENDKLLPRLNDLQNTLKSFIPLINEYKKEIRNNIKSYQDFRKKDSEM